MNNNQIITVLQNFEKPDKEFLYNKECLICIESVDIESQLIVKLPCKCANSVYHISCVILFLNSGENKNFCPHCKANYELRIEPERVVQIDPEPSNNLKLILVIHILSNSIMNIANISLSDIVPNFDNYIELKVLLIFYYLKLFTNYFMIYYSKTHVEKIQAGLAFSYIFQIVLFGFLIYSLVKLNNMVCSVFFLLNNIFFIGVDLFVRLIVECKMRNRVFCFRFLL